MSGLIEEDAGIVSSRNSAKLLQLAVEDIQTFEQTGTMGIKCGLVATTELAQLDLVPDDLLTLDESDPRNQSVLSILFGFLDPGRKSLKIALDAVTQAEGMTRLINLARMLHVDEKEVTVSNLAAALGISRTQLYRLYSKDEIRRARTFGNGY